MVAAGASIGEPACAEADEENGVSAAIGNGAGVTVRNPDGSISIINRAADGSAAADVLTAKGPNRANGEGGCGCPWCARPGDRAMLACVPECAPELECACGA